VERSKTGRLGKATGLSNIRFKIRRIAIKRRDHSSTVTLPGLPSMHTMQADHFPRNVQFSLMADASNAADLKC
jgi:hypothetical protein